MDIHSQKNIKELKTKVKKSIILALALMFVAVSANAEIEPTEVVHREGEQRSIEKVYVLPLDEPDEPIPTDGFAEDGVQYEFAELHRRHSSHNSDV